MTTHTIEMQFKKSTKGTHVYESTDKDTPVPTIYIKRDSLPSFPPPKQITLTVQYDE